MRHWVWALLTTVITFALAGPGAVAQDTDAIQLEIADCAGVAGAGVRSLVALEVAPRTVLDPDNDVVPATRGGLECRGEIALIWVEEAGRATPLRLEIKLLDLAPQARPRLLALAIAELIATGRLPGAPRPKAAEREPPDELVALPEPAEPPSFHVWLGLGGAREAEPIVWAPSLAGGVVQAWDALALAGDLRFDRGRRTDGDVQLGVESLSLGLTPAWRVHDRSYQLLLGPGVRGGYAWLHGVTTTRELSGGSLGGFWFGPCAHAALHVAFATRWALRAGIELGYLTQTVRGLDMHGEPLFELHGVWVSAHAAVSWRAVGD